ncbi:MAG: hypothetical protein NW214_05125 [Pseudanabaenaceae cyanobacterium bins.39]|nr:hypothetical protein [Pseudanabaenaceae cyanobacterium bins.39]
MASKSTPNRATSLDKASKVSPKKSPNAGDQSRQKTKVAKGSMGLGLLLITVGSALAGLGVLGYFVYQELVSGAQREAGRETAITVQRIESRLTGISQSVNNLTMASALPVQQSAKAKSLEPFQGLIIGGLKDNSQIVGLGVGSTSNIVPSPSKVAGIYVWRTAAGLKVEPAGRKLSNDLMLSNRTDVTSSSWFKSAMENRAVWSQPYDALGKKLITYVSPISDATNKVVGVAYADAIALDVLAGSSSSGYVIFSNTGNVVAADANFNAQDPAVAGAISNLGQQAAAQPAGVAHAGGNIWAYQKVTGSDWVVATYVSEQSILTKVALLWGGAAVGISGILAIAILSFVNNLKKRLNPLVEECDRFLTQQGHQQDATDSNVAKGQDELDRLSDSLKNTLHYVKANEMRLRNELASTLENDISQSQQNSEETQLLEAEVGDLLDVVSSMEEGDLTIEAQVNDRATGLVADTLNRLREKLVEIISSVLGTAQQVAQGASDLEELAKTVVLNTAEQAQSVVQGQALTEQVAAIAQRSAEQVNIANLSLQEVRDTVADGQVSINMLTESISVLQTGSAQIVQRMKTLGEFVGLAEQFVQDQGQIAYSTQILAQNATLVAARASEQKDPKQFASVAREFGAIAGQVDDLATRTNDGLTILQQRTSQIQTVVTAIDAEVQNLSGLVAGFTEGVEASQAAFGSIQSATEEVVQIGQTITASSTEIAEAAESTATYISEIAQLAERTADLTRSARQQAEAMGNQAQQLLQGIQFFRLPEAAIALSITDRTSIDPDVSKVETPRIDISQDDLATTDNEDSNLGFAIPALAVAGTAAAAISLQQLDQTNNYDDYTDSSAFDLDSSQPLGTTDQSDQDLQFYQDLPSASQDGEYIDDLDYLTEEVSAESISSEISDASEHIFDLNFQDQDVLEEIDDDNPFDLPVEAQQTNDDPMVWEQNISTFTPEDNTNSDSIPDISTIEASLLADLKQEVYDQEENEVYSENYLTETPEDLSVNAEIEQELSDDDLVNPLEIPLENVDESAIAAVTVDPMIADATSAFMENTEFGTPAPLSEERLANIPVSVDFSIPDLEHDEDFTIPPMQIESSLDDSSSFFDAGSQQPTTDNLYVNVFDEAFEQSLSEINEDFINQNFPEDTSNDLSLDASLDLGIDDQLGNINYDLSNTLDPQVESQETSYEFVSQFDDFSGISGDEIADPFAFQSEENALEYEGEDSSEMQYLTMDSPQDELSDDLNGDLNLVDQEFYSPVEGDLGDSEGFVLNIGEESENSFDLSSEDINNDYFSPETIEEDDNQFLSDISLSPLDSSLGLNDVDSNFELDMSELADDPQNLLQDLQEDSFDTFTEGILADSSEDEGILESSEGNDTDYVLNDLSLNSLEDLPTSSQLDTDDSGNLFLEELQDRLESSTFDLDLDAHPELHETHETIESSQANQQFDAQDDYLLANELDSMMVSASLDDVLDDAVGADLMEDGQNLEFWQSEAIASEMISSDANHENSDNADIGDLDYVTEDFSGLNALDSVDEDPDIFDVLNMDNSSDALEIPSLSQLILDNASDGQEFSAESAVTASSFDAKNIYGNDDSDDSMDLNFLNISSDFDANAQINDVLALSESDDQSEQFLDIMSTLDSTMDSNTDPFAEEVNDSWTDLAENSNNWNDLNEQSESEAENQYLDDELGIDLDEINFSLDENELANSENDSQAGTLLDSEDAGDSMMIDELISSVPSLDNLGDSSSFADDLLDSLLGESNDVAEQNLSDTDVSDDVSDIFGLADLGNDEAKTDALGLDADIDNEMNFDFAGLDSLLSSASEDLSLNPNVITANTDASVDHLNPFDMLETPDTKAKDNQDGQKSNLPKPKDLADAKSEIDDFLSSALDLE